jgi:hypothetical protein
MYVTQLIYTTYNPLPSCKGTNIIELLLHREALHSGVPGLKPSSNRCPELIPVIHSEQFPEEIFLPLSPLQVYINERAENTY